MNYNFHDIWTFYIILYFLIKFPCLWRLKSACDQQNSSVVLWRWKVRKFPFWAWNKVKFWPYGLRLSEFDGIKDDTLFFEFFKFHNSKLKGNRLVFPNTGGEKVRFASEKWNVVIATHIWIRWWLYIDVRRLRWQITRTCFATATVNSIMYIKMPPSAFITKMVQNRSQNDLQRNQAIAKLLNDENNGPLFPSLNFRWLDERLAAGKMFARIRYLFVRWKLIGARKKRCATLVRVDVTSRNLL